MKYIVISASGANPDFQEGMVFDIDTRHIKHDTVCLNLRSQVSVPYNGGFYNMQRFIPYVDYTNFFESL